MALEPEVVDVVDQHHPVTRLPDPFHRPLVAVVLGLRPGPYQRRVRGECHRGGQRDRTVGDRGEVVVLEIGDEGGQAGGHPAQRRRGVR